MRVVFMGTPEFAVPALIKIAGDGHIIAAAYTRAPKPGGRRGLETRKTPIHQAAEALGVPVFTPPTLRLKETQEVFQSHAADVSIVIAYGLLLPKPILQGPRLGCLNLHASLLPRWRGAAPIQRAVMAGDTETGMELMLMEEGLDTGPVGLREVVPIRPEDTAGDLAARLTEIAAALTSTSLDAIERGTLRFEAQAGIGASYAHKIDKPEAAVDWTFSAERIRNHIHGLSPTPGAFSRLQIAGRVERVKLLRARTVAAAGAPGTILDNSMTVACGEGAVRILEAQRSGRRAVAGDELMRRELVVAGATFK